MKLFPKSSDLWLKSLILTLYFILLVTFISILSVFVKTRIEMYEAQLSSFRKAHEMTASLSFILEEHINSVYRQMLLENVLNAWLQKKDYTVLDIYDLSQIQKSMINIVNSDPELVSMYLYNKNNGTVLSTNYMFTSIDSFPEKELFNQQQPDDKGHWMNERFENVGGTSHSVITFIAPLNNNTGYVAINVNRAKLFQNIVPGESVALTDNSGSILAYTGATLGKDSPLSPVTLLQLHETDSRPISISEHFALVSSNAHGKWEIISLMPHTQLVQLRLPHALLLLLLLMLIVANVYVICRFFSKNYVKPMKEYKTNLDQNLDDLQHNFILNILTGKIKASDIRYRTKQLGIQLQSQFLVIVFHIDDYYNHLLRLENEDRFNTNKTIYNAIKWYFSTKCSSYTVKAELEKIAILVAVKEDADTRQQLADLDKMIRYIQKEILDTTGLTVCAGISDIADRLENAHMYYSQAFKAINSKLIYGKHSVIYYKDVAVHSAHEYHYPAVDMNKINTSIRGGDLAEVQKLLDEFCDNLIQSGSVSIEMINAMLANTLFSVVKYALELRYSLDDIFHQDIFIPLFSYEVISDKKDYVVGICQTFIQYKKEASRSSNKTLKLVLDYINKNYDKRISLTTVSEEFNINASYVSLLIKNELGLGFVEYVNELRVKKSAAMLCDQRIPIREVSEACGYDTVHSFIRNFKKVHIVTPSEYRNRMNH
ncbi:helix-turn-helix domain-containing protein [Paenibacillus cremeus]|uniref:Helix-turn-helix transcriptional regulator n=1 Tax=Paenibacillus cremeus TaxID=2163881 RepID=A0A559K9Q2_9BACL|nr:helix-turn-helix domain-containing protein [Paenibacillus cremeus]TVY08860.1 helix-turn-helix transcriptional regulator [Paenibacillus cremeus]